MRRLSSALALLQLLGVQAVAQNPKTAWRNLRVADEDFHADSAGCATAVAQKEGGATTGRQSTMMFRCLRERRWQRVALVPKRDCPPAVVTMKQIEPGRRDSTQTRALLGRIADEVARRWVPSREETTGSAPLVIEGFGAIGFMADVGRDSKSSPTIRDAFPLEFEADTAVDGGNGGVPVIDPGNIANMPWFRATMQYDARCTDVRRADEPADSSLIDIARTKVYHDVDVDRKARLIDTLVAPAYPPMLRSANVEGVVLLQFVVDTSGRVEPGSEKILKTTHDLFMRSVEAVLPTLRFAPAEANGWRVRQLVQLSFVFEVGAAAGRLDRSKPPN